MAYETYAYRMEIESIDNGKKKGFDVSELAFDISHTTTLEGQPGKLTFSLRQDPNGILQIHIGSLVRFYNGDYPVFYGFVFTMRTSKSGVFEITAYDQMRYLQNHNYLYLGAGEKTLKDVFEQICEGEKITNFAVKGKALLLKEGLKEHFFNDVSDYDILKHCLNEANTYTTEKKFDDSVQILCVGAKVEFSGGDAYVSPTAKKPSTSNRTAGEAVITVEKKGTAHPYHIKGVTSNVEGWVNADAIKLKKDGSNLIDQSYFFIRDEFGTLTLNDIETNVKYRKTNIKGLESREWDGKDSYRFREGLSPNLEPLIIGDESLLTDYDYEVDIDKNTYNQLFLLDTVDNTTTDKNGNKTKNKSKKVSYVKQNEEAMAKWGVLRKIVNLKQNYEGADEATRKKIEEYANLALEVECQISKTLSIEALGYNGVNAGDGFLLSLKKLGIYQMMYVISATHNYGTIHTMSLEVATSKNLCEVFK